MPDPREREEEQSKERDERYECESMRSIATDPMQCGVAIDREPIYPLREFARLITCHGLREGVADHRQRGGRQSLTRTAAKQAATAGHGERSVDA